MRERGTVEVRSEIQTAVTQMQTFVRQALNEMKEPPSAEQAAKAEKEAQITLEDVGFGDEVAKSKAREVIQSVVNHLGPSGR
jgi:hypothetical protein